MLRIKRLLATVVASVMLVSISSIYVGAESDGKVMDLPKPCPQIDVTNVGKNIQKTMHKLANGEDVTICLYGQSITSQDNAWTVALKNHLEATYPNANITWKNLAIGGWGVNILINPLPYDFKDVQPDLVLLYVYGSNVLYEQIVAKIREMTTAEIMMLGEHKAGSESNEYICPDLTDTSKSPDSSDRMTYQLLPQIAKKYNAEFCDIRTPWYEYLSTNGYNKDTTALEPGNIHLNDHGQALMFNLVKQFFVLRNDVSLTETYTKEKVYNVGTDINWVDGKLTLPFEGNKVEIITDQGNSATASVTFDGKAPSQILDLYNNARVTPNQDYYWGNLGTTLGVYRKTLYGIDFKKIPVVEDLTVTVEQYKKVRDEAGGSVIDFKFSVVGSKSGDLGSLTTQMLRTTTACAPMEKGKESLVASNGTFEIPISNFRFEEEPRTGRKVVFNTDVHLNGVDTYTSVSGKTILAQGLANGEHKLVLTATDANNLPAIKAIKVYNPKAGALKKLAKPKSVKLKKVKKKYMLSWKKVANNNGYSIRLFRNNKRIKTLNAKKNTVKLNLTKYMKKKGKYYASVAAKGKTNKYTKSSYAKSKKITVKAKKK